MAAARRTDDGLLTRDELAALLGESVSTLRHWAVDGEGPRPMRVGSRVAYRRRDVQAWRERQDVSAL